LDVSISNAGRLKVPDFISLAFSCLVSSMQTPQISEYMHTLVDALATSNIDRRSSSGTISLHQGPKIPIVVFLGDVSFGESISVPLIIKNTSMVVPISFSFPSCILTAKEAIATVFEGV